jgi:retinol dehydrogenase 12
MCITLMNDVQVSIVTGYVGCGYELAKILYQCNGTVYLAGRTADKGYRSVKSIREQHPESEGHIEFLKVDLADLSTIKPAVEAFLSKSKKLHCLTNNAGVMMTPDGSKTAQVSISYSDGVLLSILAVDLTTAGS